MSTALATVVFLLLIGVPVGIALWAGRAGQNKEKAGDSPGVSTHGWGYNSEGHNR